MEIKYSEYFETKIKEYFTRYSPDLKVDVYSDYEYKSNADVIVILKQMLGTIQNGTIQIPYQLIVRVDSEYKEEVKRLIDNFAFDYNETIQDVGVVYSSDEESLVYPNGNHIMDNTTIKIKQYLSTSAIIGAFEGEGLKEFTTLTANITIFTYNNPLDINEVKLNGYKVAFTDLVIAYAASVESSGGLGTNGACKQFKKTSTLSYVITCLLNDNISWLKTGILNNTLNTLTLKIDSVEKTVVVSSASLNKNYQGFPSIVLNLVEG